MTRNEKMELADIIDRNTNREIALKDKADFPMMHDFKRFIELTKSYWTGETTDGNNKPLTTLPNQQGAPVLLDLGPNKKDLN